MRESKKKKIGLVDLWLSLFHRHSLGTDEKRRQLAQRTFNSILVYSTTALGDYMFNSPALRAIRQRYPQAHIVLVAHPKYKQLLTRRDFCDDVLFWNNKFSTVTEFARRAKVFAPEMAIMLHSHLPYDVLSAAMSGCRYLVRDNYGKDIGRLSRWLTFGLDQCPGHIINRGKCSWCQPWDVTPTMWIWRCPATIPLRQKMPGYIALVFSWEHQQKFAAGRRSILPDWLSGLFINTRALRLS